MLLLAFEKNFQLTVTKGSILSEGISKKNIEGWELLHHDEDGLYLVYKDVKSKSEID